MRRTKSNRPEPLAKAFTKDNQIYFRLQTALMEDVSYNSVIGRNLVNFAFLDQDLLERCMLEFFAVYVQRRDRGVHPEQPLHLVRLRLTAVLMISTRPNVLNSLL